MFFASLSSFFMAQYFGTLTEAKQFVCGDDGVTIHPLIRNISTIVDFLILNPLVIYLLQKTAISIKEACEALPRKFKISGYHQFGITIISILVSLYFMKLYIVGNLAEHYFDSNIFPDENGNPYVTISGWIVFFWTWLFIAFLVYRTTIYSMFVIFLISIKANEIRYVPFHDDGVGGIKSIVQPCVCFAYAMIFLLIIFILFMIQDYAIDNSTENIRLLGFVLYIILSIPLFYIPLIHLHTLMKEKKAFYIDGVSLWTDKLIGSDIQKSFPQNSLTIHKCDEFVQALETIEKYKKIISEFPHWPLSRVKIIPPISSFIGAFVPLAVKLFFTVFKVVGT